VSFNSFFFQAEDGIRDFHVTGVQTCALPIYTAGPGLIFWHPKGGLVRTLIENWLRDQYLARGYGLVFTPHVAKRELWKISGHARSEERRVGKECRCAGARAWENQERRLSVAA